MKKRLFPFCLAALLASCSSVSFSFAPYSYGELNASSFEKVDFGIYERVGEFASIPYKDGNISPNNYGVYSHSTLEVIPSFGEQRLLVIPIDFASYPGAELGTNAIDEINAAFFGDASCNQYDSVASYYDQSSYHRLHLKGKTDDRWFRCPFSYEELKTKKNVKSCKNTLLAIYEEAISWHDASFPDDPSFNYAYKNSKGEDVVPVFFVYSAPYDENENTSMLWAFAINEIAPIGWASYYMMNPHRGKVDAHTFIHESGHLFGLKDYYAKDLTMSSPTGRADMMDCSMGDMSSFSKLLLGWVRPYVVKTSTSIVLNPFTQSGDCLLLSPSWNGSPFEEYILLEFYTPTNLNYIDAYHRKDLSMKLPESYGVKVSHVDARLGLFKNAEAVAPVALLNGDSDLTDYVVDLAKTNNGGRLSGDYIDTENVLVQTLDASSSSGKLISNYIVSDKNMNQNGLSFRKALFGKGDSMPKDLSFHNNEKVNFDFFISELTASYARIEVTFL